MDDMLVAIKEIKWIKYSNMLMNKDVILQLKCLSSRTGIENSEIC